MTRAHCQDEGSVIQFEKDQDSVFLKELDLHATWSKRL